MWYLFLLALVIVVTAYDSCPQKNNPMYCLMPQCYWCDLMNECISTCSKKHRDDCLPEHQGHGKDNCQTAKDNNIFMWVGLTLGPLCVCTCLSAACCNWRQRRDFLGLKRPQLDVDDEGRPFFNK